MKLAVRIPALLAVPEHTPQSDNLAPFVEVDDA
jgi:hypothetical protein